jgi:hypothetical protein
MLDLYNVGAQRELRAAFRARGAVTPAKALSGKELARDTPAFKSLLRSGVIREGAPGTFYLYEAELTPGLSRLVRTLLFWLIVILTPIAIIQCPGNH